MEGEEDQVGAAAGGGEHARPRKPDSETLSYLRSLEDQIEKQVALRESGGHTERRQPKAQDDDTDAEADDEEGEEEEDEGALLVTNLIDELTHKFASVSMDRHAAPIMEKLARLCSRAQLARLLGACGGYVHAMATNRYSSHVLQTLLSVVGPALQEELEQGPEAPEPGESDEEDGAPASLADAATKFAQEMQASWSELIYDLCGSHSLRALLCVLAGMPVVAERRGRHSKHQHSIETALSTSGPSASGEGNDCPQRAKLAMFAVPESFDMILESVVVELSRLSLMDLHQTICDPNSGPALCLLIQAVARKEGPESLELSEGGPLLGVVKAALCWGKEGRCAEAVYAMSGESLGSRFLEAALWFGPRSLCEGLFGRCLQGSLMEYARHDVANFVVQAWLQRTASAEQLKASLQEMGPHFKELFEGKRGGVLWRLAGACGRLKKHEKKLVRLLGKALGGGAEGAAGAKEVTRALLGDAAVDEEAGGRLRLNVTGARLLGVLMRQYPWELAGPYCGAVLGLPGETLLAVAKDNVGSRTLMDPVLARAREGAAPEARALADELAGALRGRYADLAGHPVGFHVLTQCFAAASAGRKRGVAEELVAAESRLAGAHYGRRALGVVGVGLFKRDPANWEKGVEQGEKKQKMLEEIFAMLPEKGKDEGKACAKGPGAAAAAKKGRAKKGDDVMELLMPSLGGQGEGEGEGEGAPKAAGKKRRKKDQRGEADVSFVLQAIRATSVKEGGDGKEEGEGAANGQSKAQATGKRKAGSRKEGREGKGKGKGDGGRKGQRKDKEEEGVERREMRQFVPNGETPVQKAKRLLGKRAMMSKTELLSAVGELEQEVRSSKRAKK